MRVWIVSEEDPLNSETNRSPAARSPTVAGLPLSAIRVVLGSVVIVTWVVAGVDGDVVGDPLQCDLSLADWPHP